MGTVVRFQPREADVAAKTESILRRIGQVYQEQMKAKEHLPGVLAELVEAGQQDVVLEAVRLWGKGAMEPHQVLAWCEQVAAVTGVKSVGNRPIISGD